MEQTSMLTARGADKQGGDAMTKTQLIEDIRREVPFENLFAAMLYVVRIGALSDVQIPTGLKSIVARTDEEFHSWDEYAKCWGLAWTFSAPMRIRPSTAL
jgi:hypothetical protein